MPALTSATAGASTTARSPMRRPAVSPAKAISAAAPSSSGGGTNSNGDATGVIGGAHLGYNRHFDRWVAGLEGSVDPTLMSRSISITAPNATAVDPVTARQWHRRHGDRRDLVDRSRARVRARAGYAFDRMLFYGTGGVAIGQFGSNFQLYGIDTHTARPSMPPISARRRASAGRSAAASNMRSTRIGR